MGTETYPFLFAISVCSIETAWSVDTMRGVCVYELAWPPRQLGRIWRNCGLHVLKVVLTHVFVPIIPTHTFDAAICSFLTRIVIFGGLFPAESCRSVAVSGTLSCWYAYPENVLADLSHSTPPPSVSACWLAPVEFDMSSPSMWETPTTHKTRLAQFGIQAQAGAGTGTLGRGRCDMLHAPSSRTQSRSPAVICF